MQEKLEVIGACVVGIVDSKNELAPNDNYKTHSTFIRLAGGALTLRVNGRAGDCPADGEMAIFQLERSRSGSVPRVLCWGWIASVNPESLEVEWVRTLGAGGPSSGGGIARQPLAVNGKNAS